MRASWRRRGRTRASIASSFGESLSVPPRRLGGLGRKFSARCSLELAADTQTPAQLVEPSSLCIFSTFLHSHAAFPRKPARVSHLGALWVTLGWYCSWPWLSSRGRCWSVGSKSLRAKPRFSAAAAPVCASCAELTVNVAPLPSCPVTLAGQRATLPAAHFLLLRFAWFW